MSLELGNVALNIAVNSANYTRALNSALASATSFANIAQGRLGKSLNSTTGLAYKAGAALAGAFGTAKIVAFSKSCIELGSDLQEVQNVVNVSFKTMSSQVDAFAKSAAENFGLSETMAKRYMGTFGSMANAFGFTESEAEKMSETLTGLSGDVASFYNISQDEAYTKLKSVFTGETESLKELGVVMTQIALDEYALANGFGKTTKQMSEQEKVALRYSFVQKQLNNAAGDFSRTSDGWANQMRLLNLQTESLKANLGQGLINVLNPALKSFNSMLGSVTLLTEKFKEFTEELFGSSGESESSISSVSVDAGNAAENITQADEAAQELKRTISGFDKINKLSSTTDVENQGTGSNISSQITVKPEIKEEDTKKTTTGLIEKLQKTLKSGDFTSIGEALGDKVNKSLYYLDWSKYQGGFNKVAKSIYTGVNGFLKTTNWTGIGTTVAKNINTVLNAKNEFAKNLDWEGVGIAISDSVNGFIDTYDFVSKGESWSNFTNGILTSGITQLERTNWKLLGKKIGEGLNAINWEKLLNKGFTMPADMINAIVAMTSGLLQEYDFKRLGSAFAKGIQKFFEKTDFKQLANVTNDIAQALIDLIVGAAEVAFTFDFWKSIFSGIYDFFSNLEIDTVLVSIGALSMFLKAGAIAAAAKALMTKAMTSNIGIALSNAIGPLTISLAIATIAVTWAHDEASELFDEYEVEEVREAARAYFADIFGDNFLSDCLGDTLTIAEYLFSDPKGLGEAFVDMMTDKINQIRDNLASINWKPSTYDRIFKALADAKLGTTNEDISSAIHNINLMIEKAVDEGSSKEDAEYVAIEMFEYAAKNYMQYKKLFEDNSKWEQRMKEWNEHVEKIKNAGAEDFVTYKRAWEQTGNILKSPVYTDKTGAQLYTETKKSWDNSQGGKKAELSVTTSEPGSALWSNSYRSFRMMQSSNPASVLNVTTSSTGSALWWETHKGFQTKQNTSPASQLNITTSSTGAQLWWNSYSNFKAKQGTSPASVLNITTSSTGAQLYNGLKNNMDAEAKRNPFRLKAIWDGFKEMTPGSKSLVSVLTFQAMGYANGGFPEDGWFRASHGEIMGKFDNGQSVVANNMQITTGIAKSVYPAVYSGVVRALGMSDNSENWKSQLFSKVSEITNKAKDICAHLSKLIPLDMSRITPELKATTVRYDGTSNRTDEPDKGYDLLKQILKAIKELDIDVELDGESIKKDTVRRINNQTKASGVCEIIT